MGASFINALAMELRCYCPPERVNTKPGMIQLDGRDINTIPLKTLRENIAYVPQDNFLFPIMARVVPAGMERVISFNVGSLCPR